jgi:hypothetical protein
MNSPLDIHMRVDEDEGSPSGDGVNWTFLSHREGKDQENRQISGSPPGEPSLVYLSLQMDSPQQDWPVTVQIKLWSMASNENREQIGENREKS